MDGLNSLMDGFAAALTPINLLYAFVGVLLGTAIGVLPGIGPAMTIALLLPITYTLEPTQAFIMFAGIYYGGMYGGSTTSILLNTPGESSSVVTAIEGNLMAKAGRGAAALATAAIGSFIAGTIGTLLLALLAPEIVKVAIKLGAPDFFAVMVLAFIAVTTVLGSSKVRGFAALAIGLLIGTVGIDPNSGQQRLTLGLPELADGIDVVVVAVGLFAVGEALWVAAHLRRAPIQVMGVSGKYMTRDDWGRSWKPWLRGTVIGFPFGAIPAGGAEIPTFLSYVTEKKLSKHPEEFGKGAIEGVAGPEATNNASAAGGLVPLLTLGIPTTATAAVMLGAFQGYGIQPGPRLLDDQADLVWALIASLFIGNVILLALNLPLVGMWAKLLQIPRPYLYAGILFFASVGAYAANTSAFDLWLLLVIGILGFMMRRYGIPVVPAIIGIILGPVAEKQLRTALQISDGELGGLVNTPFSKIVYVIILLVIVVPPVLGALRKRRPGGGDGDRPTGDLIPVAANREGE
ncbi:tripartite tricarboxylate transporter permease [Terracoccus luteus]|jgi:putative tricarboxylic transport membrane protein|uniref:Putative tricarboxylic transport membrane protein n=1 Tax=Terracoccus luteus TaxID=53356 RepID=A0A495XXQ3_9MICO|nr:tripartite tricarboxylate transporter permease [Terracoccus luteus]MBB2986632.1 putative tricarboxylic transport membrane protein [Terracoccus luteus]MCP2171779.1 putative tricarboxylic transport membrane protein [Terracoccus luteus]RKT79381.1 putative tricarboxylic transport membrane protein [Terracoccus luteus]